MAILSPAKPPVRENLNLVELEQFAQCRKSVRIDTPAIEVLARVIARRGAGWMLGSRGWAVQECEPAILQYPGYFEERGPHERDVLERIGRYHHIKRVR